ncbi:porin [Moraxella sp. Pampa]|uniref:porin n=1 Tax=Moraxella sp. Pampa TaxID=3111978 RepID=UPI002B40BC17|nr:porin [Moraxella sp. Pampa]
MKKLLLASAVAALSITAAQAAPQVYGKAFLTLDVKDDNGDNKNLKTELNSVGSRIGIKGGEALSANTDLVYQLEYGVGIDNERSVQFSPRDTYLGLANKQYGTLVAGRISGIDGYVDYANVTAGKPVGGNNVLASYDADRVNNAVAYFSPERNGLQFMGMYAVNELNAKRESFGIGAKYEPTDAPFKVGASYVQVQDGEASKATRVSGAYAISPVLTAGALYQNTDFNTKNNENAFTLSANYKVAQTPFTTYGQLDFVNNTKGIKDTKKQRIAVGGKYAFNKATTGHIYGAYQASKKADDKNTNAYGIGAGVEYKF